jgi:branched-chain amino acid transport system substrate-binding protein/neutral amino acid transport system substrate-binding protein
VSYDPTQTIFSSEIDKAFEAKPDFLVLVSYPETGSLILKTAYEKGVLKSTPWLLSEGLMTEKLSEMVGKDKDGRYIVAGFRGLAPDPSAGGAAYQAFRERYVEEYGREPGIYCSNTYDAAAVVLLATENAKEYSGDAVSKNLRAVANPEGVPVSDLGEALRLIREGKKINYQGTSGEITFDDHGDVNGAYMVWSVADNGTLSFGRKIAV